MKSSFLHLAARVLRVLSIVPSFFDAITGSCPIAHAKESPSATPIFVRVAANLHEGCPLVPTVLDRIRARIDRVREAPDGEPNVIDLNFEVHREGGIERGILTLTAGGHRTVRTVEAPSCEQALAALVVMAGIALDLGPSAPNVPAKTQSLRPGAKQVETSPSGSRPAADRTRAMRMRAAFSSGAALELHDLGALVVVPSVFFGWTFLSDLRPSLRLYLARSASTELTTPRGQLSAIWLLATARGCVDLLRWRTVALGPCLSTSVGELRANTVPPTHPARARRLWLTLGAAGRLEWRPLRAFSAELTGGLSTALRRDELYFEPSTVAYLTPAIMPFAGISLVFHAR